MENWYFFLDYPIIRVQTVYIYIYIRRANAGYRTHFDLFPMEVVYCLSHRADLQPQCGSAQFFFIYFFVLELQRLHILG